jgi:cytosine deaminase
MTVHAVVAATMADGSPVDVVVDGETVSAVGPGVADRHGVPPERRVDAAGGLLLPAFVDTHVHLDKVLIR